MTYDSTDELLDDVREKLPPGAQELFRNASKGAYGDRGRGTDPVENDEADSLTDVARQEVWNAVEAEYGAVDGEWVQTGGGGMPHS